MNTESPPKIIALVGGSGAGKSWLAERLCQEFGDEATSLPLDDFYRDLSHLSVSEREKINFDHPDTIDWPLFESVLHKLQGGATVLSPRYDFVSHTRSTEWQPLSPRPFIFVEGLWLLWPPHLRELFDLRVFLDCIQSLRWQRRVARDLNERGRTTDSIRKQFWKVVAPMHERFVEVQKPWADLVIDHSVTQSELGRLVATIRALRVGPGQDPTPLESAGSRVTTSPVAALQSL
jgi:uridine kinase